MALTKKRPNCKSNWAFRLNSGDNLEKTFLIPLFSTVAVETNTGRSSPAIRYRTAKGKCEDLLFVIIVSRTNWIDLNSVGGSIHRRSKHPVQPMPSTNNHIVAKFNCTHNGTSAKIQSLNNSPFAKSTNAAD